MDSHDLAMDYARQAGVGEATLLIILAVIEADEGSGELPGRIETLCREALATIGRSEPDA